MTVVLSPPMVLQFQNPNSPGNVLAGGKLFTYIAGTSTKQATWTDSSQSVQNANPIILDSTGSCVLWADPTLIYKYVLAPANDTDPPSSPLRTVDNIQAPINLTILTGAVIGAALYPQTTAEAAVSITPSNFTYPPLNVKRYGAKGDNATDDRVAIKNAWLVAKQMSGGRIVLPDGATYYVNSFDPASPLSLPNQNADGSIGTQSYQMAFYFQSASNIEFDFQGSTIRTGITGGGNLFVFDNCQKIRLIAPKFKGTQVMSTGVVAGSITAGGTLYTAGTYRNVPLTGGSGAGAVADTIVVSGGAVTSVIVTSSDPTKGYVGGNYAVNDVLSAAAANIGGTGSGFTFTVSSITGAGPTVATAAPNSIAVCAVSGSSSEVDTVDLTVDNMYSGFWMVADPTNSPQNTVTHCNLRGLTTFRNGYYAVAMHNAGDNSNVENLYAYRDDRCFFLYGVQNVWFGVVTADQLNYGFQSLIKAYSRSTLGVTIGSYAAINQPGQSAAVARIAIQVQCDPAVFPTPPTVQNIFAEYQERNITAGEAFEFDYYSGSGGLVLTATSSNLLFNNICLKGSTAGNLFTNVNLNSSASVCLCDFDQFIYFQPSAANSVDAGNGFVKARKFGFTPVLTFGGGNTAQTTSLANMEYYIRSGMLFFNLRITLTAKGSSTGAAAISLPFVPRADESRNAQIYGIANNMSGLGGNLAGFISSSGAQSITLVTQGATGYTTLADTNFTNTSDLLISGVYPV